MNGLLLSGGELFAGQSRVGIHHAQGVLITAVRTVWFILLATLREQGAVREQSRVHDAMSGGLS
jgi:hypothetical protein